MKNNYRGRTNKKLSSKTIANVSRIQRRQTYLFNNTCSKYNGTDENCFNIEKNQKVEVKKIQYAIDLTEHDQNIKSKDFQSKDFYLSNDDSDKDESYSSYDFSFIDTL